MKLNTIMKYPHRAGWIPSIYVVDPNTTVPVPTWDSTPVPVQCRFIVPANDPAVVTTGRTSKMYSKTRMEALDHLVLITDAAGVPLFEERYTVGYQITTVAPVVNMLGYIDGYAYGIKTLVLQPIGPQISL